MRSLSGFLALSVAAVALTVASGSAEARTRYSNGCGNDQALGAIAGAVIGGVIGGQFGNGSDDRAIGAIAGAVLGGTAGASVANSNCNDGYARSYDNGYSNSGYYDESYAEPAYGPYDRGGYDDGYGYGYDDYDSSYYDDAFDNADPYERVTWQDSRGYRTEIEPAGWYEDDRGNDCREFSQTIYIDGRPQAMRGTACRNPDGTWTNVS